ncbi:MAG: polysaccharide biosynthesis/export family protein [Candidatus Omnitrophica bacterium]|nr:polysaccharide biosynthesis/export family protein [Candidatus Omnitrophota bacterium]
MTKYLRTILGIVLIAGFSSPAFSQTSRVTTADNVPGWGSPLMGGQELLEYRVAPGDEILISVWKNEDLTRLVTVKGDGNISYPLIGSIRAAGITVEELQESMQQALMPYARSSAKNIIEVGDTLEIFLWRNPALSKEVTVRPDGKIAYPLTGTIQAAGFTTEQLQDKMKEGLSRYIKLPTESIMEPGDEVEVFVWKHNDLSRTLTVRGDGNITYPLIGTIKAAGLNAYQLQDMMEEKLAEYIKFPDVSILIRKITGEEVVGVSNKDVDDLVVFISSYTDEKIIKITDITVEVVSSAGNKVLVFGEVGNEGIYLYKGTITVLEAIAMAGGIRTTGKRESIIVVSGNMTDNPQARRINLFRILRKGTPKTDIVLTPNDVIYVPRTFIADVNRFYADIQPTLDQGMSIFDWRDAARAWYRHTIPE